MWLVMFIIYIFLSVISCILSESIVMVRDVTQIFFYEVQDYYVKLGGKIQED